MDTDRIQRSRVYVLSIALLLFLSLSCQTVSVTLPTPTRLPLDTLPPRATEISPVEPTSAPPTQPPTASRNTPAQAATPSRAPVNAPVTVPAPAGGVVDLRTAIRNVAQRVRPAIVQITNEQVQVDQFNKPFTVPAGVGSGVIYDRQGHIMTNNHVIAGAERLLVSLPDGRSFPGQQVGADPQTDLAVIQITGDDLPIAQLGDSKQLQVGDWVVAIGNALALPGGPTVTTGVVGALNRTVQEPGENGGAGPFLFDVIQTDAPINPGNSGGALCNLDGQVIGINTLVAGQAEPGVQAQGIGFAVSMATAKTIADQLVASGRAVHPFLGIAYEPLTPSIASQIGANAKNGVVLTEIVSGSPAEQAGLQPRDVITDIDHQSLQEESSLAQIISSHKPGDTITLTVVRGRRTFEVQATLVERPQQ